jgi:lysophospholipase L1-like esterase
MLLYTVGDSFTYGEELPDPAAQAWPALLSKKLGYDLVNRGKPGRGNNYVVKDVIKQIPKLKPDLVIIAWTSCGRMEFADRYSVYDIWPGTARRFERPYPHRDIIIKYITSYNNELHQYKSWLRSVILLQDFLKLRNINYKFVSTFDNHILNEKYAKASQEYIELIDTNKFIGWPDYGIVEWMADCPKGPGGHPLELGHTRIADEIFNAL